MNRSSVDSHRLRDIAFNERAPEMVRVACAIGLLDNEGLPTHTDVLISFFNGFDWSAERTETALVAAQEHNLIARTDRRTNEQR